MAYSPFCSSEHVCDCIYRLTITNREQIIGSRGNLQELNVLAFIFPSHVRTIVRKVHVNYIYALFLQPQRCLRLCLPSRWRQRVQDRAAVIDRYSDRRLGNCATTVKRSSELSDNRGPRPVHSAIGRNHALH